jgi:hypothetical protein
MKKLRVGVLMVSAMLAACSATPEIEDRPHDTLVRVASRPEGGVYRDVGVDFTGYKRLMIEPLTVSFANHWRRQHPNLSDSELHRIVVEAAQLFHEEFIRALVDEGPYELAQAREADVLVVEPRLLDLDIPAPEGANEPGHRTLVPRPVAMQMTGELRDGVSGALLMRVIMFDGQDKYVDHGQTHWAYRITNAHEIRVSLGKWSQLFREALDVAKATKPAELAPGR